MAIDYDTIMQGLMDAIEAREEAANWSHVDDMCLLRKFRTVGLTVPRQSGRTRCGLKRLVENERSILLVCNKVLKGAMSGTYKQYHGRELTPYEQSRIYTARDVIQAIARNARQGDDLILETVEEIIVDDAWYFFDKVRRNSFYKWLADRGGKEQKIILLG